MDDLQLAFYSYVALIKKFYLGDFAYNHGCSMVEAERCAAEAKKGGFISIRKGLCKATRAGLYALLGKLGRKGGRWWLLSDLPLTRFSVEVEGYSVQPFTWLLWDERGDVAAEAYIVQGDVGDSWLRSYASAWPFREIAWLRAYTRKMLEKIGRGEGSPNLTLDSYLKMHRRLNGLKLLIGLPLNKHVMPSDRGELAAILIDILEELDRVEEGLLELLG